MPSSLAHFIERNLDRILLEWDAFARTRSPASDGMDQPALRDDAEAIVRGIAADLAVERPPSDRLARSRGRDIGNADPFHASARRHALLRFKDGFSLDQMVSEYRALRFGVARLWTTHLSVDDSGRSDPAQDLRAEITAMQRFDEAVDEALTESIALYAEQLSRARDLLAGILAHDLRNPLSAIMMSTRAIAPGAGNTGDRTSDAAKQIERSGARMVAMIGDLLDFTRTRLGTSLPISTRDFDAGAVCRQVVQELAAVHPEREIRLTCEGDLSGRWDDVRLAQLLSNLVGNAIKHGSERGPVAVRAAGSEGQIVIEVHNDGAPIAAEDRRNLFDPLFRAQDESAGTCASTTGIGLGLFIARQIVLAHGGHIDFESTGEGGTTFRVRLPREAPITTAPVTALAESNRPDGRWDRADGQWDGADRRSDRPDRRSDGANRRRRGEKQAEDGRAVAKR